MPAGWSRAPATWTGGPTRRARHLARMLQIAPGDEVHVIERLRTADGIPMAVERSHVPDAVAPGLSDESLAGRSLYDLLASTYGRAAGPRRADHRGRHRRPHRRGPARPAGRRRRGAAAAAAVVRRRPAGRVRGVDVPGRPLPAARGPGGRRGRAGERAYGSSTMCTAASSAEAPAPEMPASYAIMSFSVSDSRPSSGSTSRPAAGLLLARSPPTGTSVSPAVLGDQRRRPPGRRGRPRWRARPSSLSSVLTSSAPARTRASGRPGRRARAPARPARPRPAAGPATRLRASRTACCRSRCGGGAGRPGPSSCRTRRRSGRWCRVVLVDRVEDLVVVERRLLVEVHDASCGSLPDLDRCPGPRSWLCFSRRRRWRCSGRRSATLHAGHPEWRPLLAGAQDPRLQDAVHPDGHADRDVLAAEDQVHRAPAVSTLQPGSTPSSIIPSTEIGLAGAGRGMPVGPGVRHRGDGVVGLVGLAGWARHGGRAAAASAAARLVGVGSRSRTAAGSRPRRAGAGSEPGSSPWGGTRGSRRGFRAVARPAGSRRRPRVRPCATSVLWFRRDLRLGRQPGVARRPGRGRPRRRRAAGVRARRRAAASRAERPGSPSSTGACGRWTTRSDGRLVVLPRQAGERASPRLVREVEARLRARRGRLRTVRAGPGRAGRRPPCRPGWSWSGPARRTRSRRAGCARTTARRSGCTRRSTGPGSRARLALSGRLGAGGRALADRRRLGTGVPKDPDLPAALRPAGRGRGGRRWPAGRRSGTSALPGVLRPAATGRTGPGPAGCRCT